MQKRGRGRPSGDVHQAYLMKAMEGALLGAGGVAVLMGLGALVEAARPRRGGHSDVRD
jgi:hypothetical protein